MVSGHNRLALTWVPRVASYLVIPILRDMLEVIWDVEALVQHPCLIPTGETELDMTA